MPPTRRTWAGTVAEWAAVTAAALGVAVLALLVPTVGAVAAAAAVGGALLLGRRTERRLRAELAECRDRDDRLRLLESAVVHARDAVIILEAAPTSHPGRSVKYVNEAFTRMTGYAADEVLGRSLHFLRGPQSDPGTLDALRDALDGARPLQVELLNYRKDGSPFWVELSLVPVPDAGGRVGHWVMIQRDVTDRKRAADDLRDREYQLRAVGDNLPDGAVYQMAVRPDGADRFTYISAGIERLAGVPAAAVLADSAALRGLVHPDDRAALAAAEQTALGTLAPFECEFRLLTAAGAVRWVLVRSMPSALPDGVVVWNGVVMDVTGRKRAEDALRQSEERYRLLFESNPHPMWVFDEDTLGFLAVNEATVRKYGWTREEFLALTILDVRPPEDLPKLLAALADGPAPLPAGWRHRTKDGTPLAVETLAHRIRFDGRPARLVLVNDVTERNRLEDLLRQAQKMETVGQLAGGIAHDFNNLLTGVVGNLARVVLPDGDPNRPILATAEKAAQRAAELTKKLLGFARKNQLLVAPARVAEFADEVIDILRRTFDPRITIDADLSVPDPVAADTTLINQALLNLCLNARDAMPAGGRLSVTAAAVTVTADDAARHPDARPGEFVRLSVADTGHGMTDAVRAHIFEPFFTTKPVGQGTGLGLPMVHGILKQHNGWVDVRTEVGAGTRFDLYLPRHTPTGEPLASGALKRAAAERLPPPDVSTPPPAGRTVLLVDDEELIRDLGRSVLESAGYEVMEATDGADAVEVFARDHARIDLVVLDLTMPRLSGRDAFRSMTALVPSARVLFSSGYSADDLSDLTGAAGLLAKPYRPQELLAAVRRAMAGRPVAQAV